MRDQNTSAVIVLFPPYILSFSRHTLNFNVSHRTQVSTSTIQTRIATLADLGVIAPMFVAYRQYPDLDLAMRFIHARIQNDESVVSLATSEMQEVIGFCQLYPTF